MSKSGNPYSLGSARSVGKAISTTSGKIADAISTGFDAFTGIKKHKLGLEHLATEADKDRVERATAMDKMMGHSNDAHAAGFSTKMDYQNSTYESTPHPLLSAAQAAATEPVKTEATSVSPKEAERLTKMTGAMTGGSSTYKTMTPAQLKARAARRKAGK